MSVEIRDGRIHWIGPASQWQGSRATVRIVDGRARTLIPGLMDCHVHYSGPGGPDWIARFSDPLPEISMRAIELAEASLRSGVTTARDVGAPQGVSIKLAHMARAGEINAPNIRAAGTWIAHHGTYVSFARHFGEAHELRKAILKPWRTTRPSSCQQCRSGMQCSTMPKRLIGPRPVRNELRI